MLKRIRFSIERYLGFSQSEANGLIILIPLVVVLMMAPVALKIHLQNRPDPHAEQDQKMLEKWLDEVNSMAIPEDTTTHVALKFSFDPNKATVEQFETLGIHKKTASRIVRYRDSGGRFYKKEDLMKIYGISKQRVEELWDYIDIPQKAKKKRQANFFTSKEKKKKNKKPYIKIELNTTCADSLIKIRGIGPVLSKRIIKYRDRIGGFVHVDQLEEVYGLKDETLDYLKNISLIDSLKLTKININKANDIMIAQHPYIPRYIARTIVEYRNQHGSYNSINDLHKIKIMNDSLLSKMKPYLVLK